MTPMTATENMCFRKAVFNSRPEADRYIGNMNRYTRRGGHCPRGVHPYRCPWVRVRVPATQPATEVER